MRAPKTDGKTESTKICPSILLGSIKKEEEEVVSKKRKKKKNLKERLKRIQKI